MKIRWKLIVLLVIVLTAAGLFRNAMRPREQLATDNITQQLDGEMETDESDLAINSLRKLSFPGSDITIERTIETGGRYAQYVASYLSEGNKIYALLTVPTGEVPEGGWPVIVFNHGYIPPAQYRTTERYVAYVDGFARNGYIVFKIDYRGHGDSQGEAVGGYGSNAYTIDALNAVASIKKFPGADPNRIGMWGHSMGGFVTLRSMVVTKDIKVGVIWAGVVASYTDLLNNWRRRNTTTPTNPPAGGPTGARRWRQVLTEKYGTPEQNPQFWSSISANSFLSDISGPIQLHHGTSDTSVPYEFSQKLESELTGIGKNAEIFIYPGDDHNLSRSFGTAMSRSVEFFDQYLKSNP